MEPIYDFMSKKDLIPIDQFKNMCDCGAFIDYDGYGYYSDGELVDYSFTLRPSHVRKNGLDQKFTHILWLNR